jgi:hypothetical protein
VKQRKRLTLNLIVILASTAVFAANGRADSDTSLTLDVAWDCRTFNYMRGLSLDQIVRADGFMMNGTIYRAGTLQSGSQSNEPNAPGAIGTWVARGNSTGSLAQHIANPTQPAIYWTQYLSLSGGMIITEGWHAPNGTNDNAVVGGTRAYRGANGDVTIETLGTNATGCANTRFRIIFAKQNYR